MPTYSLSELLKPTNEKNIFNSYEPVAVGKYGIRKRSEIYTKDLASDFSKNKVIRYGSLIIGMGSKQIDFGVLCEDESYCVSPAYHTYSIDTKLANPRYLELALKASNSHLTKKYMIASARQGKAVDTKGLFKEKINLPTLNEQSNFVRKTETIIGSISKLDARISECDLLIKSLFNDLLASTEYPLQPLGATCEIITGNTPPRSDKENYGSYIEWIKSDNISDAKYPSTAEEFLSEKGCALGRSAPADSILMVCIAGSIKSIGRCALLNRRVCFNQQINALIPKRYEPVFLLYLLRYEKKLFEESIHNALKGILSKSALASIELPVLPLPLQKAAASKINQIDKLRSNYQHQIDLLNELLEAKMEEYFGGAFDAN